MLFTLRGDALLRAIEGFRYNFSLQTICLTIGRDFNFR
jgi:hypothetical protein